MTREFYMRFPTLLGIHGTAEIKGTEAKNPADKKSNYVKKYYDIASRVGKKFNLNPLVILAQASIESGWGTSNLALNHNNFFGITSYGSPNEYWHGEKYTSKTSGLSFRVYRTAEDGFSDFARLITKRYPEAAKAGNNVTDYAHKIAYSPYINEANGDNRSKYKELIMASANFISEAAKKIPPAAKLAVGGFLITGFIAWLSYEFFIKDHQKN